LEKVKTRSLGLERKRTPPKEKKMSCYVGKYCTKFEPTLKEEMGTHAKLEAVSAGSLKKIPRNTGEPPGN